jgi:DNA-directed RNA polymerase specialized sigma24 family protein
MTAMLRYFSRCRTYQAIAEVTGVPAGTVRSRLNRARARLGTALLHTARPQHFRPPPR